MRMNAKAKARVMRPCPATPNCVSSIDRDSKHYIEPLRFEGSAKDAHSCLLKVLLSLQRTRLVVVEENYIHAESVSAVMRFVDDIYFLFDDRQKGIHLKSASRVGYYDLGVNRRRLEKIRKLFNERIPCDHDHQ